MPKSNNKSLSINKGSDVNDSVNPNYRAKKLSKRSLKEYVEGVKNGDRTILSQAITLIESSKNEYREFGQQILEECLPETGNSIRIGVTGVPGVGKSTFIEALGQYIIQNNHKLAVLTIDPSSSRSKGSILGDKTRMQKLSTDDRAFIRPSPTSGTLGGVAQKTRETMLLCEAAGYDIIFIETVGVGQSETTVHSMVDFFLLLMLAGAGDELQGIKRGIMEMADLIAINKAEGDNIKASKRAKREYENALSLFPPSPSGWKPKVLTCSALQTIGIEEIWSEVQQYLSLTSKNGFFEKRRKEQAAYWMYETINRELKQKFYSDPVVKEKLTKFEKDVQTGKISSFKAAKDLLELFDR
ncbi:methylmalonyl Co-A mutase-associated GTPase MeaB [Rhodohalobacter sp.]|uniref:methylmalonyl Co-A mutase-associated GTPase MeaB n=1 Tax=Rhodohalobacter sp. TaxID=1974210 RepID=UPI002ACDC036|nr:methylmalonyl Co-A mutase-associated GTPase MeaB [Rhodohalobacter sp.]MDZ7758475.1 methylmalonyl Co-A mutase-associated GTPase MeaB [Rhodohalobacter sp.]